MLLAYAEIRMPGGRPPSAETKNPQNARTSGHYRPPALKRLDFKVLVSHGQPRQGKNSPPEGQQSPGTSTAERDGTEVLLAYGTPPGPRRTRGY